MLTHLTLNNFKSWQHLDLPLGQVTGLFGTNSSGKSSILQFLLMLKQTKDATDRGLVLDLGGQNQLVNLGSYKSLIYKHQEDLVLKWSIDWDSSSTDLDKPMGKKDIISISDEVFLEKKEIKIKYLKYIIKNNLYGGVGLFFQMKLISEVFKKYEYDTNYKTGNYLGVDNIISCPIKTHLFPSETKSYEKYANFLRSVESSYEILMDKIYYLDPLREHPKREYQWSGASPSHVGYRGENTIHAILAATFRNETRIIPESNKEKPFQEVIAYWLKKLGLIHEFKIKEISKGTDLYRVIVKKEPNSTEAFLTDVGFGVSQVLPAIVLLYYVPEGSIILMEQPEIHLHPSVQSGLADVILQVSKQRNIQVIVESHSEHLLRRFQRRVAEEQYSADNLKLYFCNNINGESTLSDLQLNEFGEIMNWPENFFGDEMAEMAAICTATLNRKIQKVQNNAE